MDKIERLRLFYKRRQFEDKKQIDDRIIDLFTETAQELVQKDIAFEVQQSQYITLDDVKKALQVFEANINIPSIKDSIKRLQESIVAYDDTWVRQEIASISSVLMNLRQVYEIQSGNIDQLAIRTQEAINALQALIANIPQQEQIELEEGNNVSIEERVEDGKKVYRISAKNPSFSITNKAERRQNITNTNVDYAVQPNDEVIVAVGTLTVTLSQAKATGQTVRVCNEGTGIVTIAAWSGDTVKREAYQTLYDGEDLIVTDIGVGTWV